MITQSAEPDPIVLALGCNIGPRRETLELACRALARGGVRVVARSRLYWTRPWGFADQPEFINAAVAVRTALAPDALLARCRWVEWELGRRHGAAGAAGSAAAMRWGPRRIDLDLALYGAVRRSGPRLTLPHPRLAERDFVLAPLLDLGAQPRYAEFRAGWAALLAALPPAARTIRHAEPWRPGRAQ